MYMVGTRFCFQYPDALSFAQLSYHLPDIPFDLPIYYLPAVFRCKYDMILAIPRCMCYMICVNFHVDPSYLLVLAVARPFHILP